MLRLPIRRTSLLGDEHPGSNTAPGISMKETKLI
nr:MAG TPA: hypothetical protein [Caudoviricetes sp.]